MKKILSLLLSLLILLSIPALALAEEYNDEDSDEMEGYYDSRGYCFELSSDEMFEVYAGIDSVITITLRLIRTDSDDEAEMYCFQDELHYDGSVFEIVPDSFVLAEGVNAVSVPGKPVEEKAEDDETSQDEFNDSELSETSVDDEDADIVEFEDEEDLDSFLEEEEEYNDSIIKISYILPDETKMWPADVEIASFQLKVLKQAEFTFITNENAFVCTEDGLSLYDTTCVDLVAICGEVMDALYTVIFIPMNGEEEIECLVDDGQLLARPEDPFTMGNKFTGWYLDEEGTQAWDFENDIVDQDIILYGAWETPKVTDDMLLFIGIALIMATASVAVIVLAIRKKSGKDSGKHVKSKH